LRRDALAAATAGAGGVFLFATWTAPSRIIKFQVDETTLTLNRTGSVILPRGGGCHKLNPV
jgi:hypothetical protein